MGQPQFVHLHLHTDYSLLDGACETSQLLDEASRQKMPAVAITDHGNLFTAANFLYEASKRVRMLTGCATFSAKGISSWKSRIRDCRSKKMSTANCSVSPKRPAYRSLPRTIVITCITTTRTPRKCCSASRPARP